MKPDKKLQWRKDGVRALAEGIILQSIEDLWCGVDEEELLRFFDGEGFNICAGLAGIDCAGRVRLLGLVRNAAENICEVRKRTGLRRAGSPVVPERGGLYMSGDENNGDGYNF